MENQKTQSEYFAWSPEGLKLLDTINQFIEDNGGREELYKIVTGDDELNTYQRFDREKKAGFTNVVRNKIPYRYAAILMDIPYTDFCRQIFQFKKEYFSVSDPFFKL